MRRSSADRGGQLVGAGAEPVGAGGLVGGEFVDGRAAAVQDVQPGGERLQHGQAERLVRGRRDEDVHRRQQVGDVEVLAGTGGGRGGADRAAALAQQVDTVTRAELLGRPPQGVPLGSVTRQQQVHARDLGDRPDQDVEPLAGHQPSDAADHEGVRRQPQPGAGGGAGVRVEREAVGLDAVGHHVDALLGHSPADQPGGDGVGDGDRGGPQPFGGPVQLADAAGQPASLDHRVAQGVLGGDHGAHTGQPGGDPAVDAGAVEVGVHQVVVAVADQPGQAGERGEVPVAGHPEVGDGGAVRLDALGDRARIGEGDDLAGHRQPAQHQPQLLLGAAHFEAGDDVQNFHRIPPAVAAGAGSSVGRGRRRRGCSARLRCSRQEVSEAPMWTRGRACREVSGPGSMAQAYR